jgi:hypothetical protein
MSTPTSQSHPPARAEELLAVEIATFERELPRLLTEGEAGRWAVVKGNEVVSVWDTVNDALQAAHERLGLEPFLLREVREEQRIPRVGWGFRKA